MSDILCVTSRGLCGGGFLRQVEKIAAAGPAGILLREKDLTEEAYEALAGDVLSVCRAYGVPCILHTYPGAAQRLGCSALHMPLPLLEKMSQEERSRFSVLGASCHSEADVRRAEALGCTYVTAGHVFETQCKAGLPPRGLEFLRRACRAASVPVYAIGGISPENIARVRAAGAAGACVMSSLMTAPDPEMLLKTLEERGLS